MSPGMAGTPFSRRPGSRALGTGGRGFPPDRLPFGGSRTPPLEGFLGRLLRPPRAPPSAHPRVARLGGGAGPARPGLRLAAQAAVPLRPRRGAVLRREALPAGGARHREGRPLAARVRMAAARVRLLAARVRLLAARVRLLAARVRLLAARVRLLATCVSMSAKLRNDADGNQRIYRRNI
eukprot:gene10896-biopygen4263